MNSIIAKFETTLASSLSDSATTATLVSVATGDGVDIPNGTYGFVIDEGNSSEEFIIATLAGTALSSMVRGLSYVDGINEVAGNAKAHRKGAIVRITDHPALAQAIAILNGETTIDNVIKSSAVPTDGDDLANKDYVDGVAISGAPDSSETVKGITKLSTAPDDPAEPIALGENDPRVPTSGEAEALEGTLGVPGSANKYVTYTDFQTNGVKKSGDQTIAGTKTFSSIPVLPSTDPSEDDQAARKSYVDKKGLTYISSSSSSSRNPTIAVPANAKIAIIEVSCKSSGSDTLPYYGEIFITKTGKTAGSAYPVNKPSTGTGLPIGLSASWTGDNIVISGQTTESPSTTIYFYS